MAGPHVKSSSSTKITPMGGTTEAPGGTATPPPPSKGQPAAPLLVHLYLVNLQPLKVERSMVKTECNAGRKG